MVFLFGIKPNLLARAYLENCKCPNCEKENTLVASKYGSYFHVFFIPFFPTGKSIEIGCAYCNRKFDGKKYLSTDIFEAMNRNRHFVTKKRPVWHLSGCMGCSGLILLVITGLALLCLK